MENMDLIKALVKKEKVLVKRLILIFKKRRSEHINGQDSCFCEHMYSVGIMVTIGCLNMGRGTEDLKMAPEDRSSSKGKL